MRVADRGEQLGGYKNLSFSDFRDEAITEGDSIFYGPESQGGHGGTWYRIVGAPEGFGGPYLGGDLNYINQGLIFAAGEYRQSTLDESVVAWNMSGNGSFAHLSSRIYLANFGYGYWTNNHAN